MRLRVCVAPQGPAVANERYPLEPHEQGTPPRHRLAESLVPGARRVRLPRKLSRLSIDELARWLRGDPPALVQGRCTAAAWAAVIERRDYELLEDFGVRVDLGRHVLPYTPGPIAAWVTTRDQRWLPKEHELLPLLASILWELEHPRRKLGLPHVARKRWRGLEASTIEELSDTLSWSLGMPRAVLLGQAPSGFDAGQVGEAAAYFANVRKAQEQVLLYGSAMLYTREDVHVRLVGPPYLTRARAPAPRRAARGGLRPLARQRRRATG